MITKTFEVVTTRKIRVNLPDSFGSDEFIKEWESGLWQLDEGVTDIAAYAARIVAEGNEECSNDGVGRMVEESFAEMRKLYAIEVGQVINPLLVTFKILEDDMETTLVEG